MGLSLKPGLLLLQFQLQARTQLQVKKATLLGPSSNSACHCQMLITAFIVCLGMMVLASGQDVPWELGQVWVILHV